MIPEIKTTTFVIEWHDGVVDREEVRRVVMSGLYDIMSGLCGLDVQPEMHGTLFGSPEDEA